jgi:hypothetical protein
MSDPHHPPAAGGGGKKFDAANAFMLVLVALAVLYLVVPAVKEAAWEVARAWTGFFEITSGGVGAYFTSQVMFGNFLSSVFWLIGVSLVIAWAVTTFILPTFKKAKGGGHDAHAHPAPHAEPKKADKPKDEPAKKDGAH